MNSVSHLVLAGKLDVLGDSWIAMLTDWGTRGFKAALIILVVYVMVTKFSLKAGIAALLLMAVALGIYESRNTLAAMFTDEINNPSQGAPAPLRPGPDGGVDPGAGQ
ncbi:hypothetical protein [Streptomyces sp. NPDC058595]|uniref:hypothetical protein n=1 Tax=Streptomyces sp. NPDC058595 TaxID=3346550 RepID=UPI0036467D86